MASVPLLLALMAVAASALPHQPRNPVVGIVTVPSVSGACITSHRITGERPPASINATSCFWAIYMKWLEESGVRVVPFLWDDPWEKQEALLGKINGILFTGGELSGNTIATYYKVVQNVTRYATERYAKGDPFVVWGTCQGFQLLSAAVADDLSVIIGGYHGMNPAMLSVNFTANQPKSKMFGEAPSSVLWDLSTKKTTVNWHSCGVLPTTFETNPGLKKNAMVLTTNEDDRGKPFVSSFEAKNAAIFATQWHPERVFELDNDALSHSKATIHCSQYLSMFLRDQLQKNNHSFATPEEAEKASIANYNAVNMGFGVEIYYFHRD